MAQAVVSSGTGMGTPVGMELVAQASFPQQCGSRIRECLFDL
eukprot:CAMPEP_0171120672 /NCGR_PEP_ID=MMETSP0766_2-20121228/100325_1 /TAXON_ID=439317 /ORGANISM="Gambierdiscus australes, Strain CAWD 149" /LENGTH=41 /DNA_ID= /DNA_START= /DNA_END= /DNA_ORIENTATION=